MQAIVRVIVRCDKPKTPQLFVDKYGTGSRRRGTFQFIRTKISKVGKNDYQILIWGSYNPILRSAVESDFMNFTRDALARTKLLPVSVSRPIIISGKGRSI